MIYYWSPYVYQYSSCPCCGSMRPQWCSPTLSLPQIPYPVVTPCLAGHPTEKVDPPEPKRSGRKIDEW